jgi:hypothetical protein
LVNRLAAHQRRVRATVFAWGEDRLGITYEFADWRRQAQTIGDDDWLVMTRLERYGALTYRDDNANGLRTNCARSGTLH